MNEILVITMYYHDYYDNGRRFDECVNFFQLDLELECFNSVCYNNYTRQGTLSRAQKAYLKLAGVCLLFREDG